MSECFPKPKSLGANVKVELDLSNYAAKADLKMQQLLIHRILLKKTDLANLKSDVDKLEIVKKTKKLKNVNKKLLQIKQNMFK